MTSEPNLDFVPVWMPDSRSIIYQSVRSVDADLYRRAVGSNAALLFKAEGIKTPMDVSRDGQFLLYGSSTSNANTDIWLFPLDGSTAARPLVETRFVEGGAQFSPDGRWFIYASNETGRFEVYLRPFTEPGAPRRVSTGGGNAARWSHNGRELFYLAPDGQLTAVKVAGFNSPQLTIGTPTPLFMAPIDPSGFSTRAPFVVSNDDQRFLIPIAVDKPTPASLVVIENWHPK
jgi:Tol biopolymer transport system component